MTGGVLAMVAANASRLAASSRVLSAALCVPRAGRHAPAAAAAPQRQICSAAGAGMFQLQQCSLVARSARSCGAGSPAVAVRWMTMRSGTPWMDPRNYEYGESAEDADEEEDDKFGLPTHPRGYKRSVRPPQLIGRDQLAKLPIQSTISINRCAVVKKGGKVLSYAAIVVVGNGKGLAAIGKGKDKEVGRAVDKAVARAHRLNALHYFELYDNRTVFHDITARFKCTKVIVMAPSAGTGLKCNDTLMMMCEAIGIQDLQAKIHGSNNPHNTVAAFWKALTSIRSPREIARIRGKAVIDYASLKAGLGPGHSTLGEWSS